MERLLRGAARVYGALLVAYPVAFRRAWGRSLTEVFRDASRDAARRGPAALARFWLRALGDLFWSALAERWTARHGDAGMGQRNATLGTLTALGTLAFGWLCLHTDETGILAVSVAGLACALALIRPRRAWLAALPGLAAPGAQLLGHLLGWHVPGPNGPVPNPGDWSDVAGACLALLFSIGGAVAGACGGRALALLARRQT